MLRAHYCWTVLVGLATLTGCGKTRPVELPPMPELGEAVSISDDPFRQFDFWLGEWDVQNKHFRGGGWIDSGQAVARIQSVAGGNAVLEEWTGELGGDPLIGFSLRAFDPDLELWPVFLNWHQGKPSGFSLMHGRRNGERMELFPPGDTSSLRYSFSLPRTDSCQWDSASSEDGETWVTDWVMQFTRRQAPLTTDASTASIIMPPAAATEFPDTRALDFLLGAWQGDVWRTLADGSREKGQATMRVTSMIGGFGLLQFIDDTFGNRSLQALGFDSGLDRWVGLASSSAWSGIRWLDGDIVEGAVTFTEAAAAPERLREVWVLAPDGALQVEIYFSADGGETWNLASGGLLRPIQ